MNSSQQETLDGDSKQFIAPDLQRVETPRDLVDSTAELLRVRLRSLAMFLLCVLGISLILSVNLGRTHFWAHRIGAPLAFAVVLTTWVVLRVRSGWSVAGLHKCEFAILGSAAIAGLVVPLCLVPHAADAGNQFRSLAVIHANFAAWSILILTYGSFIPNTAKRAATILIPIACLPLLVNLWLRSQSEAVADALTYRESWLSAPLPFVATFAAVFVARTVSQLRRNVFAARQLGQYTLKRKIATGGMGDVYEAEHMLLKRRCALKMIRTDRQTSPNAISQFEREVKAAAELTHWNTIDIFDYGFTEDGRFYYVMALLNGLNLEDLVTQFGPLEPGRAINFLCQACNALDEAHSNGLIHRDLKPANLFAGPRGGVWDHLTLLDFGLVKGEIAAASHDSERSGLAGTPLYMSPEQVTGKHELNARADIYALGAVGYFLLSGKPPFEDSDLLRTMMAHVRDKVKPLRECVPELPRELTDIIERCLQKNPADRFQDVRELRSALAHCESVNDWNSDRAEQWWRRAGWC
ncbi:MAG: serine/threonine protein kinase [Planctomycetaceae bacterium]|nr:serine/threonine protein kinase [Planctomycetales bacterium]MCB9921024.1 serine/threonine protein kinase [Planctomycetaceae bacterium]